MSEPVIDELRQSALNRCLGLAGALLLTLSAVTPASSVFVIVPGVIAQAGTGALLSMLAAAFLCIPIAYVYAELSSAFPIAGGEYCIVGRTLGKDAAFAVLGLATCGSILAPTVLALGASTYIGAVIPVANPRYVAIAIVVATTCLGILHIRANAWITGVFLILELLALLLVTALGFWHTKRSLLDLAVHPISFAGDAMHATPLAMIGLGISIAIFAYDGYGSTIYFSEEVKRASHTIGKAIIWAFCRRHFEDQPPLFATEFLRCGNLLGTIAQGPIPCVSRIWPSPVRVQVPDFCSIRPRICNR